MSSELVVLVVHQQIPRLTVINCFKPRLVTFYVQHKFIRSHIETKQNTSESSNLGM